MDRSVRVSLKTFITLILLLVAAVGIALTVSASRSVEIPARVIEPVKGSDDWRPAQVPLVTRFAASVSPTKSRPDYPRPQMVRKDWISLNGLWQFGFDDENVGDRDGWKTGKNFAEQILVPFTFESALSGIGKGKEVHERVWYRRSFETPSEWSGKRILLNFGGVDWDATVYLNGREIGQHRGAYAPFSFDITDHLKNGGPQELVVKVYDPAENNAEGWQPRGKQKGSEGIWYTRTTGIWQSVWMEPVAPAHIASITMTPGLTTDDSGTLELSASTSGTANGATLDVEVGGVKQAVQVADGKAHVRLSVPKVKAWTPETPNLYDLTLKVTKDGKTLDAVSSYTAFRSVGIANGRLTLNGKPYFYRGVLDQGYWPDGILTPPSDDAIKYDVEMTRKLGFNMARKHIKAEDPRWYYWCDKLGVAVWQDMPATTALSKLEARENFRREWADVMNATRNYPCVVHWIPFNENWGDPGAFQDEIVEFTRKIDPSRPITDASGWTQRSLTDVIDAHNYSDSLVREGVNNPTKPKVVGEYGGVGLSIPGHVWQEGRIYIHTGDEKQMREALRRRTSQLFQAANLSGFVYTQLTDVEQELNGLMTYDREPKADVKALARIMRGEDREKVLPLISLDQWLILGPIPAGVHVPETRETPESMTAMTRILDTQYIAGEASLAPQAGEQVNVKGNQREWTAANGGLLDFIRLLPSSVEDSVVYAVAYFDSPRATKNSTLLVGSDDGVVVWLNGKEVHRKVAIRGVDASPDRVTGLSLKKGRNTLVFKVGQGSGGWGLTAQMEKP